MYDQQENDYELLYLIYQKDDESLALLMMKYENIMYMFFQSQVSLMYRMKGHVDEYQIGRIVLIKALENYRLDKDASFRHYYLCLLKNEMRNTVRKNDIYLRTNLISTEFLIHECEEGYLDGVWRTSAASMQADWIIHSEDIKNRILKLEASLSEVERKIFRLRIYGYSYQEISHVLNVSIKKVDNTLFKVRNHKV